MTTCSSSFVDIVLSSSQEDKSPTQCFLRLLCLYPELQRDQYARLIQIFKVMLQMRDDLRSGTRKVARQGIQLQLYLWVEGTVNSQCLQCGKLFEHKRQLAEHQKEHLMKKEQQLQLLHLPRDSEKATSIEMVIVCPVCLLTFSEENQHNLHFLQTHSKHEVFNFGLYGQAEKYNTQLKTALELLKPKKNGDQTFCVKTHNCSHFQGIIKLYYPGSQDTTSTTQQDVPIQPMPEETNEVFGKNSRQKKEPAMSTLRSSLKPSLYDKVGKAIAQSQIDLENLLENRDEVSFVEEKRPVQRKSSASKVANLSLEDNSATSGTMATRDKRAGQSSTGKSLQKPLNELASSSNVIMMPNTTSAAMNSGQVNPVSMMQANMTLFNQLQQAAAQQNAQTLQAMQGSETAGATMTYQNQNKPLTVIPECAAEDTDSLSGSLFSKKGKAKQRAKAARKQQALINSAGMAQASEQPEQTGSPFNLHRYSRLDASVQAAQNKRDANNQVVIIENDPRLQPKQSTNTTGQQRRAQRRGPDPQVIIEPIVGKTRQVSEEFYQKMEIVRPLLLTYEDKELRAIMKILYTMLQLYSVKELRRVIKFNAALDLAEMEDAEMGKKDQFEDNLFSVRKSNKKRRAREENNEWGAVQKQQQAAMTQLMNQNQAQVAQSLMEMANAQNQALETANTMAPSKLDQIASKVVSKWSKKGTSELEISMPVTECNSTATSAAATANNSQQSYQMTQQLPNDIANQQYSATQYPPGAATQYPAFNTQPNPSMQQQFSSSRSRGSLGFGAMQQPQMGMLPFPMMAANQMMTTMQQQPQQMPPLQ